MKGEYISIETLRIYQEIEKENKELQEKINKPIQILKNHDHNYDGAVHCALEILSGKGLDDEDE